MSSYKDVEKKLQYYKQQVLQELVKKGVYPDDELIESKLKSFDAHMAIFKNYNVVTGKLFNANEYNERLKLIYTDLNILYELLYEITVLEYNKLQNFINSHLAELNSIVQTYNKRAEYENSTTSLGKTLLFQNNSFSIESKDSTTILNLDNLDIPNAAVLACIANINNVKAEDVIFKFRKVGTEQWLNASPYNYNNDILIMPGEKRKTIYEYNLQDSQVISGPLLIDIDTDINIKNDYTILGGKNNIFVNYKDENGFIVEEKPITLDSLVIKQKAYINFYVIDGSSISFRFNKKPIATNFPIDVQRIDDLDYMHHFFIECDEDFSFQFDIDKGQVYAIKETGLISNNSLYYTGSEKVKDFKIIESATGDVNEYEVKVEAYNSNDAIDIDSIIIKQIE